LNAKTIAGAAKQGNELAIEIYKECGYYLGMGLSMLIDILNPEIIVIGSIFSRSRDLLWPWAEEVIKKESLALSKKACKIVPAFLGDKIGDYASLAVALG
jgi:glucokinase